MYEQYWGLKEKPFENTPDPRFLYLSPEHDEALSRLLYVVMEEKGCAMLTGVYGCGKTLLAQALLNQLDSDIYRLAIINNPFMTDIELLRAIATHLGAVGLPTKRTELLKDVLLDTINELLTNNANDGRKSVVIIDEGHTITDKTIFEELRMLLNFQTQERFLLTLLLFGQPELRRSVEMNKQLNQRLAIRCNLDAFNREEVAQYIAHRLNVAGKSEPIFNEESLALVFEKSGGIPRRINQLCDMSLLIGMEREVKGIDAELIKESSRGLEI